MPNNDLPKLNPDNNGNNNPNPEMPRQSENNQNKPVIEIPQEYYEKIRQEKAQQAQQEQDYFKEREENREANKKLTAIVIETILNCAIALISFHIAYNQKDIAIFAIPIIAIIGTLVASLKNKKESTFHISVLIGGMVAAVISYVLCIAKEDTAEYWMHIAISCAVAAFASYVVCAMLHNLIANKEKNGAIAYVGFVVIVAAMIGVPYYFYQKNPEEIYKTIFMKTTEVKAETEEEFVLKTLKNRYGIDFECINDKVKVNVQNGRKIKQRTCYLPSNKEVTFVVHNIVYNEFENKYIVTDNYLDILSLNDYRIERSQNIREMLNAQEVNFYLYPKENCTFIGDCAAVKEYYDNLETETNIDRQYQVSSSLNYEKYTTMNGIDIVNDIKPKVVISIVMKLEENTADFSGIIDKVLDYLNRSQINNANGYQITIYNLDENVTQTQKKVWEVTGTASQDGKFSNPQVVTKK